MQPTSEASDSGELTARPGQEQGRSGNGTSEPRAGERQDNRRAEPGSGERPGPRGSEGDRDDSNDAGDNNDAQDLSPEERARISELRARDREVRQHEQAHQVVGGQFASPPTFTFERGPNGQLFAVGGQVSIDVSPVPDDPQATLSKMQVVRAAALAPAEPSSQDLRVAQEATSQMLAARAELSAETREEVSGLRDSSDSGLAAESGASRPGSEGGSDARIDLFRNVDNLSEASPARDNGSRLAAIA